MTPTNSSLTSSQSEVESPGSENFTEAFWVTLKIQLIFLRLTLKTDTERIPSNAVEASIPEMEIKSFPSGITNRQRFPLVSKTLGIQPSDAQESKAPKAGGKEAASLHLPSHHVASFDAHKNVYMHSLLRWWYSPGSPGTYYSPGWPPIRDPLSS